MIENITGLQLHRHHKKPRHMGGTDDDWNISYPISVEDHIIWHMVLARMFPQYEKANITASLILGGSVDQSGPKNHKWKGGISYDMKAYGQKWMEKNKGYQTEYHRKRREKFLAQGLRYDGKPRQLPLRDKHKAAPTISI